MTTNPVEGIKSFEPPRRVLMGTSSTPQNVTLCLDALETLMADAASR